MVLFGNRKYACLTCIRGHRSSSCEHRDRILLQVRKPGRKSQTEPNSRFALVAKESSDPVRVKKESDYKLVKVPDVKENEPDKHASCEKQATIFEDDDVVVTEKYVFVHMGDNMFKRELRPGYKSLMASPRSSVASNHVSPYSPTTPSLRSPKRDYRTPSPNSEMPPIPSSSYPMTSHSPHSTHLHPPPLSASAPHLNGHCSQVGIENGFSRDMLTPNSHGMPAANFQNKYVLSSSQANVQPEQYPSTSPRQSEGSVMSGESEPPLVIGPMQFQHDIEGRQANILNELGLSIEEASQIWSADAASGDFSFAAQCVLPGQCQCGDACECPDCYEHQRLKHRKGNRSDPEKQAA